MPTPRTYVMIPINAERLIAGAKEVEKRLISEIREQGLSGEVKVIETGTLGPSNAGVVIAIQPDGVVYGNITPDDVPFLVKEHLIKGRFCSRFLLPGKQAVLPVVSAFDARSMQSKGRIVLDNCGRIDPESLDEYIANDGYFALGSAVTRMTPAKVIETVKASGLRGRGGAGFPTGVKWGFCADVKADQKYIICNADEGEPGTFKDRLIMEGDPHKVLEGMAICGYAIGATKGYVYIRGEYKLSIDRLRKAIDADRKNGLLGLNLFGSGFDFDVEVKIGAGAYICGEETALIESMEGKRGMPRLKPPFPAQCGYKGKPTNVNNVETLANIPAIIRNGAEWFRSHGTAGTPGTKVYTVLGHVNSPGLIEVPVGVTLREVIEEYAGGMRSGSFHIAQLGGTAGDVLGSEMLDVPLDYDSLEKVGHTLGSGAILITNETVDIKAFLRCCMRFFLHETCGNCNPCRNGVKILCDITERLKNNKGRVEDIDALEEISMTLKSSAFCPLGQSPASPIMSALRYFRTQIEAGVDKTTPSPAPHRSGRKLTSLSEH